MKKKALDFESLVSTISMVDTHARGRALGAVALQNTFRNWLIGRYIVEYEQEGSDRARYGEGLIDSVAARMKSRRGFSARNLRIFREFYKQYPQIGQVAQSSLSEGIPLVPVPPSIPQSATAELPAVDNQGYTALSPKPQLLVRSFSFTHFVELMRIDDPLKRAFYEIEGIKGNWSVSQLKRQIGSLLYERTGLSTDKKGLVESIHKENNSATIDHIIRDPYILEFTGLPESTKFSENDLETALLDHIQNFLLELGNGFCFEARQKRISLDNEHDYVDLVFYHRILRCHVLIDLKIRKFRHADAGQMNFYVNYYRDKMMADGDSPPVGLILCTHRDETVVKYATGGLDNRLFVSKYLTALPSEETIQRFLEDDREDTEFRIEEARAAYGGYTS